MHILRRFLCAGWLILTAVRQLDGVMDTGLVVHLLRVGSEARGSSEQGF